MLFTEVPPLAVEDLAIFVHILGNSKKFTSILLRNFGTLAHVQPVQVVPTLEHFQQLTTSGSPLDLHRIWHILGFLQKRIRVLINLSKQR